MPRPDPELPVLPCATCAADRVFQQPDAVTPDSPEWLCTACGEAVLLDPPRPQGPAATRRAA